MGKGGKKKVRKRKGVYKNERDETNGEKG